MVADVCVVVCSFLFCLFLYCFLYIFIVYFLIEMWNFFSEFFVFIVDYFGVGNNCSLFFCLFVLCFG